jgi:hypothetical protein
MSLPSAMTSTLSTEELRLNDAYWRAANYVVESCGPSGSQDLAT